MFSTFFCELFALSMFKFAKIHQICIRMQNCGHAETDSRVPCGYNLGQVQVLRRTACSCSRHCCCSSQRKAGRPNMLA